MHEYGLADFSLQFAFKNVLFARFFLQIEFILI